MGKVARLGYLSPVIIKYRADGHTYAAKIAHHLYSLCVWIKCKSNNIEDPECKGR